MSAVCIIPARGGSRRIPRKNIKLFHGKPIIAYSIETAKASELFNRVVVNTEDRLTAMIAWDYGASVQVREAGMELDEVGTQEVMRSALFGHNFDYACCIYPCAPMMTADDLKNGRKMLDDPFTLWSFVHGWYYWGRTPAFLNNVPLEVNYSAPMIDLTERYIDINTPEDWAKAEAMYAALHPEVA